MTKLNLSDEPTARADDIADAVRQWYERHRETWWDRHWPLGAGPDRSGVHADEFMLRLISVVNAVNSGIDVNDGTW